MDGQTLQGVVNATTVNATTDYPSNMFKWLSADAVSTKYFEVITNKSLFS